MVTLGGILFTNPTTKFIANFLLRSKKIRPAYLLPWDRGSSTSGALVYQGIDPGSIPSQEEYFFRPLSTKQQMGSCDLRDRAESTLR